MKEIDFPTNTDTDIPIYDTNCATCNIPHTHYLSTTTLDDNPEKINIVCFSCRENERKYREELYEKYGRKQKRNLDIL